MRVLVSRPEPDALATAAKLERLGAVPLILPLSRVVSLRPEEGLEGGPPPGAFDAVAATSANALRHTPADLLAALRGLPAFAVGGRTAAAFAEAGFGEARQAHGDAATLASLILAASRPPRRLAYLCGRVRRPDFEDALGAGGIPLLAIETYDTRPVAYSDAALGERLEGRPVDAALVYSARGAEALGAIAARAAVAALFERTAFLCLSAKIAAALPPALRSRARIAAEPMEEALLALL